MIGHLAKAKHETIKAIGDLFMFDEEHRTGNLSETINLERCTVSKYQLTKAERETIITYDEEGPMATVYTCNRAKIRQMDAYCAKYKDYSLISRDEYSSTYTMPKRYVLTGHPSDISDETRARRSEQARRQFYKQKMVDSLLDGNMHINE